jgi:hypothetical protein
MVFRLLTPISRPSLALLSPGSSEGKIARPAIVFLMYFTFLDRTNLRNARIAGMDKDLALGTYGFNVGGWLYYAIDFFADLSASLCVIKFGFVVLPLSCIAFGVVTIGIAFVRSPGGLFAVSEA